MTARCASTLTRATVTTLLVLAVSPVTAPFLTFDLKDLLGDSPSSGVAIVQPKTAHDEPVSTVAVYAALLIPQAVFDPVPAAVVDHRGRSIGFLIPLRI